MTPSCDTCQLDFRPGEEADMETWERDGIARCRACAREFAAITRMMDTMPGFLPLAADDFWRALDDALASPLAADIDARLALYPPRDGAPPVMLISTPGLGDGWVAERFIPGPVQIGPGYFPGGVTIHSRSRPHG